MGDSRGADDARHSDLATTHLGALKELATQVPGVVNASLQFDVVRSRQRID